MMMAQTSIVLCLSAMRQFLRPYIVTPISLPRCSFSYPLDLSDAEP